MLFVSNKSLDSIINQDRPACILSARAQAFAPRAWQQMSGGAKVWRREACVNILVHDGAWRLGSLRNHGWPLLSDSGKRSQIDISTNIQHICFIYIYIYTYMYIYIYIYVVEKLPITLKPYIILYTLYYIISYLMASQTRSLCVKLPDHTLCFEQVARFNH